MAFIEEINKINFKFLWKRIVQMNDDTMTKCIQGYVSAMH